MTLSWRVRDASKAPPLLRLRSSKWFILATVSIAVFTVGALLVEIWCWEVVADGRCALGYLFIWPCEALVA